MDTDPHKTSPPHPAHQILVYQGNIDALKEFLEHILQIASAFILKYKFKERKNGSRLVLYAEEFPGEPDYLLKLFLDEIEFNWSEKEIKLVVKRRWQHVK